MVDNLSWVACCTDDDWNACLRWMLFNREVKRKVPPVISDGVSGVSWQQGGKARFVAVRPRMRRYLWADWRNWEAVYRIFKPEKIPLSELCLCIPLDTFQSPLEWQKVSVQVFGGLSDDFGVVGMVGFHYPTAAQQVAFSKNHLTPDTTIHPLGSWPEEIDSDKHHRGQVSI